MLEPDRAILAQVADKGRDECDGEDGGIKVNEEEWFVICMVREDILENGQMISYCEEIRVI